MRSFYFLRARVSFVLILAINHFAVKRLEIAAATLIPYIFLLINVMNIRFKWLYDWKKTISKLYNNVRKFLAAGLF